MNKLVDIRCYITPELKKEIKLYTISKNTSVNRWLLNLIEKELNINSHNQDKPEQLNNELNDILFKLSNSANLPNAERKALKRRKNEIKSLMKGVQDNG